MRILEAVNPAQAPLASVSRNERALSSTTCRHARLHPPPYSNPILRVDVAEDGLLALAATIATVVRLDLVLTPDVMMPGLDGFGLRGRAAALPRTTRGIPVVDAVGARLRATTS